jgi:hypothetical protein
MTVQMPKPIPLEMPSGDADAIADVARDIRAAARCLAAVDARISGSAAEARGWLGEDASAAAGQVTEVSSLVRAAHDAVTPAAERLAEHAERLLETRSQVTALRHEQDEQFREAHRRWGTLPDLQLQLMIGGPAVRAIVHDVETGEASRRRRHTALLEEIEDDAAATGRVLVGSCAVVGGRGGPGDGSVVVAFLAAQLPGWGDRELARLGRALAGELTAGTYVEKAGAASAAAAFTGSTAFANALLAALGEEGVAYVLGGLGGNKFERGDSVARTLAAAFGAAVAGGGADDRVGSVLDAEYVHAEDDFGLAGTVATGLAMVLAAGRSTPSGGVGTRTVAGWGRQLLRWENEQRERIGTRSAGWAREVGDPTGLAISILAERADPEVSAALLDDPAVWGAALHRVFDDGGAALGEVMAQAGREPGERGDRVVRMGLATAGAGLAGDDPGGWTVNRSTLAGVAPGLGDAVSAHVGVAVDALQVGVDGQLRGDQADVLAGLGYVTLDRGAAAVIQQALSAWAQVRPEALDGTGPEAPLPAIAVVSAFVAVQEFAQRTDHAMDALEDRAEAEAKQFLWQHSIHLLPEVLPCFIGIGAGLLEGYGSIALDTDGTWHDRADSGLVFGRADAAALARAALAPQEVSEIRALVQQARAAFDRTAAVLTVRRAPTSPKADWSAPGQDLGIDFQGERMDHGHGWKCPTIHLPK